MPQLTRLKTGSSIFGHKFTLFVWTLITFYALSVGATDIEGDVYVEASVSNSTPYVGQQIQYVFKLYDAANSVDPAYQPPDFDGLWKVDLGVISQQIQQINNRTYQVTTIATVLYPSHVGEIIIQPAGVVLSQISGTSIVNMRSNPITLSVKALPEGRPSTFGGAVGDFSMIASLDRQLVRLGEPIKMTVTVKGTGNVESMPPPTLPKEFSGTVTNGIYSNIIEGGFVVGSREYQALFVPVNTGVIELPPITLDYFEPNSHTYRSLSTAPISVEILSSSTNTDPPVSAKFESGLNVKLLQSLHSPDEETSTVELVVTLALPITVLIGSLLYAQLRVKRFDRATRVRKQNAFQMAQARLANVLSNRNHSPDPNMVVTILTDYIADKLLFEIKVQDVNAYREVVEQYIEPEEVLQQFLEIAVLLEHGLYASDHNLMITELITQLERIDLLWVEK